MTHQEEIAAMREGNDRIDRANARERFIVTRDENDGWSVKRDDATGIAPTSSHPTAESAAARLLQLLDIKTPVAPQTWPERVCISGEPMPPPDWKA